LKQGENKSKFFHKYENHCKIFHTIWKFTNLNGSMARPFKDIAHLGVCHFQNIYKEEKQLTIVEVVRMTSLFPSFVNEEENHMLLKEITKDELYLVIHSFQKDKIPGPNGWAIEFFLGFYDFHYGGIFIKSEGLDRDALCLPYYFLSWLNF
jgi:hypothetical protein